MKNNKQKSLSDKEKKIMADLSHKYIFKIMDSIKKELKCEGEIVFKHFEMTIFSMLVPFWMTAIKKEMLLDNCDIMFKMARDHLENFLKNEEVNS